VTFGPASVRGKAVLGAAVAMTVFGVAIGAASYLLVSQVAVGSVEEILSNRVNDVRDEVSDGPMPALATLDLGLGGTSTPVLVQVVDGAGVVVASTPGLAADVRLCPASLPATRVRDNVTIPINGADASFIREVDPVAAGEGLVTCAAISDAQVQRAQSAVLLALLTILPLLVGGVCLAVWFAVGRALGAVDDLRSQAERLEQAGEATLRVQPTGDEVERLGRTLNRLLAHLGQQSRSTRQFVADAGHELRNPLTTLRVALEFGEAAPEDELRASVGEALADLGRLDRLVHDLLALARTDAMDTVSHFQRVDLGSMVMAALDNVRRTRPDVEIVEDVAPCLIDGDEGGLRSLVVNLLDNAARHAAERVQVRLREGVDVIVLHVDDDGLGLRSADCSRVFERFVRLDEARVRDEGGSGLGLAIVASVAESHGGRAEATPGPGGHFIVTLPRVR
jgi:signal transduction histidine kinase